MEPTSDCTRWLRAGLDTGAVRPAHDGPSRLTDGTPCGRWSRRRHRRGPAWSPNGTSLAVSTVNRSFVPSLDSYAVDGDKRRYVRGPRGSPPGLLGAGWLVDQLGGRLHRHRQGCCSRMGRELEGAALYSLAGPTPDTPFPWSDRDERFRWPAVGHDDGTADLRQRHRIVPAVPSMGKQVEVCSPISLSCSAVPAPAGDVAEDPHGHRPVRRSPYVAARARTPASSWALLSRRGTRLASSSCQPGDAVRVPGRRCSGRSSPGLVNEREELGIRGEQRFVASSKSGGSTH